MCVLHYLQTVPMYIPHFMIPTSNIPALPHTTTAGIKKSSPSSLSIRKRQPDWVFTATWERRSILEVYHDITFRRAQYFPQYFNRTILQVQWTEQDIDSEAGFNPKGPLKFSGMECDQVASCLRACDVRLYCRWKTRDIESESLMTKLFASSSTTFNFQRPALAVR